MGREGGATEDRLGVIGRRSLGIGETEGVTFGSPSLLGGEDAGGDVTTRVLRSINLASFLAKSSVVTHLMQTRDLLLSVFIRSK